MNILDYLKWRGDLSFKVDPFNEIDNAILCSLSYVNFDSILNATDRLSIKDLADLYLKNNEINDNLKSITMLQIGPVVLRMMSMTDRFKDCYVYNYVSILHEHTTEQFSALMVDLPDNTTAIVFRGTDDSIIGWKEDFMLSYTDIVSQADALEYVNKNCKIFNKYRLLGHSKGGNLAIYAAVHCSDSIRNRIIQVISNDGPGLRPDSYPKENYEKLKDKYYLLVPEKDVVGVIYEMANNKKVVNCSSNSIINCHFLMSWNVDVNRFEQADSIKYETDLSRKVLLQILEQTKPEERKVFVDELFEILEESNITSLSQISSEGLSLLLKTIRTLSQMDEIAKKTASTIFNILTNNLSSDLFKALKRKTSDLNDNVDSLILEYKNKLNKRND